MVLEGSVSVVDLRETAGGGTVLKELPVGFHPSAMAASPNGRYVVCANAGSDTLTVIDTKTDSVVETVWARRNASELFGASPNALAFSSDGRTLYVANGTQNAVGVIRFEPAERESRLVGLIPVGWFPGALAFDARHKQLVVANTKGLPSKKKESPQKVPGYNSHQYTGSVSLVPLPGKEELARLSERVSRNLRAEAIAAARLPARPGMSPRPVPERVGEPSVFKHVVYILKENRTYDQVLGDEPRGNGAPELCVFGKDITPNLHRLAREFVLLDNTYCAGILSADGHQWSTTAFGTAAMEKSFAGFPRSYPDGMGDDEKDALI
jgi:YVTN family beta-propeller protein